MTVKRTQWLLPVLGPRQCLQSIASSSCFAEAEASPLRPVCLVCTESTAQTLAGPSCPETWRQDTALQRGAQEVRSRRKERGSSSEGALSNGSYFGLRFCFVALSCFLLFCGAGDLTQSPMRVGQPSTGSSTELESQTLVFLLNGSSTLL